MRFPSDIDKQNISVNRYSLAFTIASFAIIAPERSRIQPPQNCALCSKQGEAREWQVSLLVALRIHRSAMPSHYDNPNVVMSPYHRMLRRIRSPIRA